MKEKQLIACVMKGAASRAASVLLAAIAFLLPVENAWAAACPTPSRITIEHRNSYCELCGVGQVTIRVSYDPTGGDPNLTNLVITEDLQNPGLIPIPGTTTINARYGTDPAPFDPVLIGGLWTWDLGSYELEARNGQYLDITFDVRRDPALTEEGLFSATKSVTAAVSYWTDTDPCGTVSRTQTLTFNRPQPQITKGGRNYDASQTTYTDPVYGHNNDDVIWQIQIQNAGAAGMQDVKFDDLMQSGNLAINYACPTPTSAEAIAANNGVLPGGSPCVAASNTINDFIVTDPFGHTTPTDYPGPYTTDLDNREIDVRANSTAYIYLVGKITANGSCISSKTNTVSGLEFGCEADGNGAGGITSTVSDSARLYTQYGELANLSVDRRLTGTNTGQPVGTKGTMTITITNRTGGSVKFTDALAYHLRDQLPPEYVMDPTFTPTLTVTSLYGSYPGRIDTVTWTNPVAGTFPLTTTDPTVPLGNTTPEFKLSSSTVHPVYADQQDMMRHGDVATITFRVVMIESDFYDRAANLDVTPEENTLAAQFTDPAYQATLDNTLQVQFDTFCTTDGTQVFTLTGNGTGNPTGSAIPAFPEDLDVAIGGAAFILTNDPNQQLTLPVLLTNNGGHDARDYHLFATFGATMEVVSAPAGCSVISPLSGTPPQPDPWKVWVKSAADPIAIPTTATVYHCTTPTPIRPGQTVTYNFNVVKTTDPARLAIDDLTFRADVVAEITLSNGTPLWFPAPIVRADGQLDRANNYSLDAVWARVIGFNLMKTQLGTCNENNPPIVDTVSGEPVERVEIGEECSYHIETGGWFGFETPGFAYIAVQNIDVVDENPDGQAYISSTDPYAESTPLLIKNVTLNPAGLTPLDEGWFDWRFNVADADRIEQADVWFRVNVTTRVLNDALNSRAAPNVHAANSHNVLNSTFDATFQNNNTGDTEIYTLGPSTIGYPNEPIRRVDLTVTEPLLTVIKQVCNETKYGAGPGCGNWTTLAADGDTYDSYIYRITVTNQASSGGVARSPAYDVVVTDTLDASDLVYVAPFESDGLDNDSDTTSDGADTNTEGAIGDNTVLNGTPAVITFSHTHSTALQRINPGASVSLYYRVDPDQRIAPLQSLTNTASASYDSLEGSTAKPSGNQTVDPRPNGEIGGARVYTSAPASATVRMIAPETYPKRIIDLSDTAIGGTPQPVKIGEEIEFQLSADLPVAALRSFYIQDYLPAGLSCSQAPVVDLNQEPYNAAGFTRPDGSAVPPITPTCVSDHVIWNFGDVVLTKRPAGSSYFHFSVTFIARVDNSGGNNDGVVLSNGRPATNATLVYVDVLNNTVIKDFGQVDVVVHEPRILLTKSFAPVTTADAGDELVVTVTARNTGNATAYNLRVLDDLVGTNLNFILGSVSGTDPPQNVDTTLGANRPIFSWTPPNGIARNAVVSFTFKVRVDTAAQPLEVLDNTVQASWTSLPGQNTALNTTGLIGPDGSPTGMRIGALPHAGDAINDYETTAGHSVSVPPVTMTKTDLEPATVPTIGAHKSFRIEIRLPEGTTDNLTVTDDLAATGLSYILANNAEFDITYEFVGIASINGQPPGEAAFTSFPADGASGAVNWQIGNVVTAIENDAATTALDPVVRINYYARVNNDTVTDAGDTLRNAATANYANGETGATETLTATTATVTVLEPRLTVAKAVRNVTVGKAAGDPAAGGDTLEYTLTIPNGGTSTAHDVNIVDTLSAGLELHPGFTPTATINGTAVAGFVATPANAPAGPLVWGRGNADGSLDVPAGQTLVLTYRVLVQEAVGLLSNSVWVDWTSLGDVSVYERTGEGCPDWIAPNDYCYGPAVTSTSTVDTTSFAKSITADTYDVAPLSTAADAVARVGDIVTYRLALNLRGGQTRDILVQDTLPTGMAFVDVVSINGDTTLDYTPPASGPGSNFTYAPVTAAKVPAAGQTGALTWNLGTVYNDPLGDATTDTLEILYRVRVAPNAGIPHVDSTPLTNTATLSYFGASSLASSATTTVRQPIIGQVTKTDRGGRTSPAQVDVATDVMQFRLQACNASGQAPAYSVLIADTLAMQLDETSITGPLNGAGVPDVYINGALATAGVGYAYTPPARGGTMTFRLNTPVNPGQCVVIDYDIGFHTDFGANQVWANSVSVEEYWSLPAESGQRYGLVGPATFSMNNVATTTPPAKTVLSPVSGEATIGEEIVYRITVPGTPVNAALFDVVVSDTLNDNLEFVSATETSGNGFVLTDNSTPPNQISLSIAQIPAGEQAVIELRARVRNSDSANAGVSFTNTALYTYADAPGGAIQGGGSATSGAVRIVEPSITAAKAVANVTNPGNAPNAGDILRYTLTFTAASGTDYADAFDVRIADDLSLGLVYLGNPTVNGTGNTIGAPTVTGDGVSTAQTLIWSLADANADIDVAENGVVTVTYDVRVLDGVQANQALTNSMRAQWTGLDGANTHERNGTGTPAYNDYYTGPATTTLTVQDANTLTKARLLDTFGAGDANARIGDIVEYELRLGLSEGTHRSVVVTDTLPQGLVFAGIASINGDATAPYAAVAPFTHADIGSSNVLVAGDAATGPTTVTLTLGDVVNVADNNAANDVFVIVYRARVLNEVHPHVDTIALTNSARLDYATATGPAPSKTGSATIDVLQPRLSVTKAGVTASGDGVVAAGELVTYTVDIRNTGTAPAYDAVLTDIIPAGLRNGAATITVVSTELLSGTALPDPTPAYDSATGIATWNFDTGAANTYTIPAGDTLRLVYRVQAESGLGAGLTLTNQAQVQVYYSFDDEAVPAQGGVTGVREVYGPTNVASATLTTDAPDALSKENPQGVTTVAIGQPFTYRVTVPATPAATALHDVRILDDLSQSAADMSFVSVTKVSGSLPWTPVNTGTATNLVIEDTNIGIDIPAGEQIVIDITVALNDTPTNVSGLPFHNTASYTYNRVSNDPATQAPGGPDTTTDLTIVGPDALTLEKSGPAQTRLDTPATFTLNVHNAGTGPAWGVTITDRLSDGMCDAAPTGVVAQLYEADGVTTIGGPLAPGSDYTAGFDGAPSCVFTVTLTGASIGPNQRLIVTYDALADADNVNGTPLTNVAGTTQWFSADPSASSDYRTYTRTLTDGTIATLDHEDAHTVTVEAAVLVFYKSVTNLTTGQTPGLTARPGDTLRYRLQITNVGAVPLSNFSLLDEVDRLNASPMFQAGTLAVVNAAGGDASATDPNGGTRGTGLLDIRNLSIGAAGSASETLVVEFDVRLVPVITNDTVVLNQAQLPGVGTGLWSGDSNTVGDTDPTPIRIVSAPAFQVEKTSQDITGDPAVLMAGDALRYTITVKNVGTENAVDVILRDQVPTYTNYVANSTRLNGAAVADPAAGVSPLQDGILINAPEDPTPGAMRADATATTSNVATITFDVAVRTDVIDGTIVANQGFVSAAGQGSGAQPEQPSDDPATGTPDDPTRDVVGNVPLVYAQKTVRLHTDGGSPGIVDPGDVLRYTVTITNSAMIPATGVVFSDSLPAETTYVAGSATMNGSASGISFVDPVLTANYDAVYGPLSPGASVVIVFDVTVNGVAAGTVISNQGAVATNELPPQQTDADGVPSNGNQPTVIVVGDAQQLSITKEVSVVGGGAAAAGGQLEYVIRVNNVSTVSATNVVITDAMPAGTTYVAGSATLNGSATGVSYAPTVLTATVGSLAPGATAVLRFRVTIDAGTDIGTAIDNTALVTWNTSQSASSSASVAVGGIPGSATVNGRVWHETSEPSFDPGTGLYYAFDGADRSLAGWTVQIYRLGQQLGTVLTDANGVYRFSGLTPNYPDGDTYEIRFRAPGAGANTATLGRADSPDALSFTDEPQRIRDIRVGSGSNVQDLNLPVVPNGVVYDSMLRTPVAGAKLRMARSSTPDLDLPGNCFDDPVQQGQVTTASGFYKFDLNFSDAACPAGGDYVIRVTPPAGGRYAQDRPVSEIIPPTTSATTAPFSVPSCPLGPDDAVPATPNHCEAQPSALAPPAAVAARSAGTRYYLNLTLSDGTIPGDSQIFNNHIPLDPELDSAVAISKTSSLVNVTRGQLVPYTIRIRNTFDTALTGLTVVDTMPPGFKYVEGSARFDDERAEPVKSGRDLRWENRQLALGGEHTIKLLLVVGAGVGEGDYVNSAQIVNALTNRPASGVATATVRVVPDPTFDCSDVIGKVFDDANASGYQDDGEEGLPGVRVVSARGLIARTDQHGRFHITCAAIPDEDRGSNFILKLDDRSLPSGYRVTTENPLVQRLTRGKMAKFNFGATIHRVVRLDIADGVFEPNTTQMRPQWIPRVGLLLEELRKGPSVLRISYLADVEDAGLVTARVNALKQDIAQRWAQLNCCYVLTTETEIFWRRGGPPKGRGRD